MSMMKEIYAVHAGNATPKKGSKAGLWLLRGFLGKKKQVIWGVYIGTIAMLIILIGTVIQILSNS